MGAWGTFAVLAFFTLTAQAEPPTCAALQLEFSLLERLDLASCGAAAETRRRFSQALPEVLRECEALEKKVAAGPSLPQEESARIKAGQLQLQDRIEALLVSPFDGKPLAHESLEERVCEVHGTPLLLFRRKVLATFSQFFSALAETGEINKI